MTPSHNGPVTIQVELFGRAQLACGRRHVVLDVVRHARYGDVVTALAQTCPALVGVAIQEDRTRLYESYILNLNGLRFVAEACLEVQAGDTLLLFSSQAGG
jgi:molybdopterin converting factor small subunit